MYTLLSGLYRHLTQKDDYFILILGLDNAGKTTFLESAKTKFTAEYKGINPNKITSTVGLNIGKIDVKGIRLNFWDLGRLQSVGFYCQESKQKVTQWCSIKMRIIHWN